MMLRASAIILLTAVFLLFLVPATAGPFSAVHGPVTALRANRAAQVFYVKLSSPARELTRGVRASRPVVLYHAACFHHEPTGSDTHAVIRC